MAPAGACIVVIRNAQSYRTRDLTRPSPTIYSGLGTGLMITSDKKSPPIDLYDEIQYCNSTYLEMSLHSSYMDRDAELATLRNPPNRHCDIFQRSDAQSV